MDLIDQLVDADPGEEEILERVAAIDVAKDARGAVNKCLELAYGSGAKKADASLPASDLTRLWSCDLGPCVA